MAFPAWLTEAIPAVSGGLGGMGGGGTTVQTQTDTIVEQSANLNVNPLIAVQTPAAHFDPQQNLEPHTQQEAFQQPDQSWRTGDPGGMYLPPSPSTQYGPLSTVRDKRVEDEGMGMLSTITSMPMIMFLGLAMVVFVLWQQFR